jgi:hypothetical protein
MEVNRFQKFQPVNLQSQYYAPVSMPTFDTHLWQAALENQQKQYDVLGATRGTMPKYAEFDRESAEKWQKEHEANIQKVTDIYASGNQNAINLGNKALNDYTSNLRQDMSTGTFAQLGQRKLSHEEAIKQIDTGTKDDPALARDYALHLYKSGIKPNDLKQGLTAPSTGKYQDIEKQWKEAKAAMGSEKTGTFKIGETWITKNEHESWSPARIQAAYEGVINDQKNKFTIDANAWSKTRNLDKVEYAQSANEYNTTQLKSIDSKVSNIDKVLNSKKEGDIKELQKAMLQHGIDIGTADGKVGEKTKQGAEILKNLLLTQKQTIESNPITPESLDLMAIGREKYLSEQKKYFSALFGFSDMNDVKANEVTMQTRKLAAQKKMQDEYLYKMKDMFIQPPTEGIAMPDTPLKETRTITNAVDAAKGAINGLNGQINTGMDALASQLGLPKGMKLNESTFTKLMDLRKASEDKNGIVNAALLKQNLTKTGSWWSQTFNADNIANLYNNPGELPNGEKLNQKDTKYRIQQRELSKQADDAIEQRKGHDFTIQAANNMWNSVSQESLKNPELKAAWEKEYNTSKKPGETLEQFMSDVLANQGTVDKKNRFYTTRISGGKESQKSTEHNVANEIFQRINTKTNGVLQSKIDPTLTTYRYNQVGKDMPITELTKQVDNDIERGLFKGYGMNGEPNLKWQDANGVEAEVKDPKTISNVKSSIVMTPTGAMLSITANIGGKTIKTYSDIREELKPTAARSMKAEAFEVQKTNPNLASQLANSARLLEDGFSAMPNMRYKNDVLNSESKQTDVVGADGKYAITDRISKDFISKPFSQGGSKYGIKRIGNNNRSVIVQEGVDESGNKVERIIKLRNGKPASSTSYDYESDDIAYKELNLLKLNSDPTVMQEVEISKQRRSVPTTTVQQQVITQPPSFE